MAKKHRAQILLEEEQFQILTLIAEREGRSISDITRRVLDAGFEVLKGNLESAQKSLRVIRDRDMEYIVNVGPKDKE